MGSLLKMEYPGFVASHEAQLRLSGVPSLLWPSLFRKLTAEIFDSGEYFVMMEEEDGLGVFTTQDITTEDPNAIFLVDHAWTFRAGEARAQLKAMPQLLERMGNLVGLDADSEEERLEGVLRGLWTKAQTYSVQAPGMSVEERMPVWYVMDEFGSAIGHSDEANFRLVPIYFAPAGLSYSLLFPVANAAEGDRVTRDYAEASKTRKAEWHDLYLLPWADKDLSDLPSDNLPTDDSLFTSAREVEQIPDEDLGAEEKRPRLSLPDALPLKVWAEDKQISKHLSPAYFTLVENVEEADVLWWRTHFKDFRGLRHEWPGKMVNQVPFESVLTVKDLLAATLQATYPPNGPSWLPRTFNLARELPQFVSEFQRRQKSGEDNTWIIKPWNLARALDTHVSNDLGHIIRLIDSGPKVACKYLENSVLFQRPDTGLKVKFDLRFIVLLKSVEPLEIFVFNGFWIRFALQEFELAAFDDYEKHFTVFNYLDKDKILQMRCEEFITSLESQYPGLDWKLVEKRIHFLLLELFCAASAMKPPRGLLANPQCRAMYGVDLMLTWPGSERGEPNSMEPRLLEVNFMPDCERACEYYPHFPDATFLTLFAPDSQHPLTDQYTRIG